MLSQEERHQENCCPEVLLSPGPAEGSHTSLPSADFAKLTLNYGLIRKCPCFTFQFSVHGCGVGPRGCVLWRDASEPGETGIGSWNFLVMSDPIVIAYIVASSQDETSLRSLFV